MLRQFSQCFSQSQNIRTKELDHDDYNDTAINTSHIIWLYVYIWIYNSKFDYAIIIFIEKNDMTHTRRSYQRHALVSRPKKGVCFWHVLIIPDQLARSSLGFQLGKAPMLWFTARIWNFPWRAPRSNPGPVMLTWMPLRLSKEMQTIEMMDMTFMRTSFKDIYI